MNSILLRTLQPPRTPSLLAFSDYREAEQGIARLSSVNPNGALLEYETLELRVHPPNVIVDNDSYSDRTLITLDSANRPGTLVEVVQLLTELGLCVTKARISSDGGWFVDEFHVTDSGKKVTNDRKLRAIKKVLSVDADPGSDGEVDSAFEEAHQCSTVFELAGNDRMGLLADVIALLKSNGCEVRSAAVWTHHHRVAFVISVLEGGAAAAAAGGPAAVVAVHVTHHGAGGGGGGGVPIKDGIKLARLRQLLLAMMDPSGQDSVVNVATTNGLIHYERRLHQLLLKEEEAQWRRAVTLAAAYEAELAEQQAQQERRWAGGAWTPPTSAAGVAGPGLTGLGVGLAAAGVGGLRSGTRPQPLPLPLPTCVASGALSALPSPSGVLSTVQSPTPAAAAAADAAAANLTSSTGSPKMGSPDGSVHGGRVNGGGDSTGSGAAMPAEPATAVATAGGLARSSVASAASSAGSSGLNALTAAHGTPSSGGAAAAAAAEGPSSSSSSGKLPAAALAAPLSPTPIPAPPASTAHKPEVWVQHTKQHNYWTVSIRCRDRQKLLFDTVCTLADLNYDVYHGAVDCEVEREKATGSPISIAVQTFYMRPRYGDCIWDAKRAAKLKYMLEMAIQRRQPTGTKVHIQGAPGSSGSGAAGAAGGGGSGGAGDLPSLTAVWRDFGLCISRAKVRALAGAAGEHTFYLVDHNGRPPADTVVQAACQQIGGVRLPRPDAAVALLGSSAGAGGAGVVSASAAAAAAAAKGAGGRGGGGPNGVDYKFGFTVYSRPGWSGRDGGGAADSI